MPNDHVSFFQFIENFNCSRLFSISLAIYGLGCMIANKKKASAIVFTIGTLIHPITAGWCLPVWMFFYYPKTRTPVAIVSFLLPLTYMLKIGFFDVYPSDWGKCTQKHDVSFIMLWRETLAVVFFGIVVPKISRDEVFLKFSKALFWTFMIGLYWSLTGGVGKHILIYQVQTWRIEWLFFIMVLPAFFHLLSQSRIFHCKEISTHHVALVFLGLAIFLPQNTICITMIALFCLFTKKKQMTDIFIVMILMISCVMSACLQELVMAALLGTIDVGLNFSALYREIDYLLLLELFLIVSILLYWVCKKKHSYIIPSILLITYCFFPQFQLIPIVALCAVFFIERKIGIKLLIPIVMLCILDVLFNDTIRETYILRGFPKQISTTIVFAIPLLLASVLFVLIDRKSLFGKMIFPIFAVVLCAYGLEGYDKRKDELKYAEYNLNQFKESPVFSEVTNYGKTFFYVPGEYVHLPRLQFLSGAYFCETTHIGEPLFEKQFREAMKRDNLIFYKEKIDSIAVKGTFAKFLTRKLSNKDSLLDRVEFLCSQNEISYFVSSLRLPELKQLNSYKAANSEKFYLYGCPNAEN